MGPLIMEGGIFVPLFVFYYFLETLAHSCKGPKKDELFCL